MSKRTWIASAGAAVVLLVATGLYVDALGTGHTDGGLGVDPGGVKSVATHRTSPAPTPSASRPTASAPR